MIQDLGKGGPGNCQVLKRTWSPKRQGGGGREILTSTKIRILALHYLKSSKMSLFTLSLETVLLGVFILSSGVHISGALYMRL